MKFVFTLILCCMASTLSAQSATTFAHTETTSASPESIWHIWTDVPNWHTWDTGLKSAELSGPFELHAKGKLIPDKGPKAKFVISEVNTGSTYTFKTRIPLGWLVVKRTLSTENNLTAFTHEVSFTGPLKGLFAKQLGKRYKAMLPEVMQTIKQQAEAKR